MKKNFLALIMVLTLSVNSSHAQTWAQDPYCLGIIYVDVDVDDLLGSGSELYLKGRIPYDLDVSTSYNWSMSGLGSPIYYSNNGIYFYFSITKISLKWAYIENPDGVFTAGLYVGSGSTGLTTGENFYIVQYQINDFNP